MLSNLQTNVMFLTIMLMFCCFVGQSATADTNSLPESAIELLSGKTTDFTSVANQIPEHQLPTALAVAKLLKFRALHGEISLSSNEAEAFETILLDRMSAARQVAFSQNEVCRKKIEQHEIMFDGQKLLVPTHFVANTDLAIIDCRPKGEAGSLFPDFNIEVFSQSQLTEVILAINGQTVNTRNILINQSANTFELSYRTPATPDSFLSIGTHTAEITINNQSGETVKQQWSFTVGCYDVPTPPLPADVKIISEIALPGDKLLPGQKLSGSLRAVIYEDAAGNRHIEYQLTTPSGQIIKSRNLAFISRKMLPGRNNSDELTLLKANRVTVEWFAPENQTSSDFSFKPQFLLDKKTEITLKASIDFGSGNNLKPGEKKYEVSVSPLSDVIESAVKGIPISVTINQPSAVSLFFGPEGSALTTQDELLVWGGEYQVKLGNVTWLVGSGGLPGVVISPTEANFSFVREHPGEYTVYARPAFEVKAVDEDVGPTRIQLEANPSKIYVSASVVSWYLDPERADHLDMLYYLRPDISPNPVWYYTNKHRIWWNVGVKASIPFVVGCGSYVHLIPELTEANRPDITRLNYQWLTTDNLPIGNEGVVNCADGADVPTPEKIGKYHLRFEAEGCDEIVVHTEVYVVQQITADTYKENFFIDCVRNSVTALSGFDKNTDGKTLIDKFYYWWWHSKNQETGNHLEYGAQAWSVKDVILRKGGMCGGLGNYFYKCLKCHGVAGLNRIGFDLLTKNYPVPDSDDKSWDPVTTEYWGTVIYTDPGLKNETMPDNKYTRWPSETSTGTYHLSYANRYTGADEIPPVDIQKVVIDRQLNVEVNTADRFYMFFAPDDGHALVFYTDSLAQTWLYDPTFGKGAYGAIKVDFPDLEKDAVLKNQGVSINTGLWSYLEKSIGYLRGFTYFKDNNIYKGISVFDIPFNRVNYLKVRFQKYVDNSFSAGGE